MRKTLIAALVTFGLGGAAAIALIVTTASAQTPSTDNPVLLAQAATPNAARGAANRGANRPAPNAARRTARRAQMCQEGYARAAGRFAYLEARLNLTGTQTGAFNRWRDARLDAAKRQAADCAARPPMGPRGARNGQTGNRAATLPSPVDRLTRQETMLQRRLADIQAERPALEALYTSLNATQRQILARGGLRRGGMMFPGRGRNANGNMMFRRGPMNGGMRGPQGPGMGGMMPPPGNRPSPPPSQYPQ
jgi:hypothetical protein